MRFHVAPSDCDGRIRRRVEPAIAMHLRAGDEPVEGFRDADVHFEPRLPSETPAPVRIAWRQRLLGVPESPKA